MSKKYECDITDKDTISGGSKQAAQNTKVTGKVSGKNARSFAEVAHRAGGPKVVHNN